MKKFWIGLVGLALLTSCGNEMPDDVIQPDKMERVLYDYHLSLGMSSNLKSADNYKKEAFKQHIFKKHRITEAEFDSSMVWYTRNAQELSAIYDNLDRRFKREHQHLETLMESREEGARMALSGDTVDVWGKGTIYWLNESPLNNQLLFEIISDTTYHPKDEFRWSVDYHFFTQGKVTMGFNVIYENDSVIGETKLVTESGRQSISLHTDSAYQIKSLNGFIHLENDSVSHPNVLLHQIALTRYHTKADSITTDSIHSEKVEKVEMVKKKPTTISRNKRNLERTQLQEVK